MDWHNLVPRDVAVAQIAHERHQMILRALRAGAKRKEIAAKLGITVNYIGYILERFERKPRRSPVEVYLSLPGATSIALWAKRSHDPAAALHRAARAVAQTLRDEAPAYSHWGIVP